MSEQGHLFQSMMASANLIELTSQVKTAEKLEHFSVYSDRLIFLSGASGSGKSVIIKFLIDQLPKEVDVVLADCQDSNWFSSLLEAVGIQTTAGLQSFQFGLGQVNPTTDLLLILDNSNELTIEQVELLANKVQVETFHCILVSDESSSNLIWAADYPEKSIVVSAEPLTSEESKELLATHLKVKESQLQTVFPESSIEQILKQTEGNPSKVMALAAKKLAGRDDIKDNFPVKKIALSMLYLFVALLLIGLLIYQDDINELINSPKVDQKLGSHMSDTQEVDSKTTSNQSGQEGATESSDLKVNQSESTNKEDVFASDVFVESDGKKLPDISSSDDEPFSESKELNDKKQGQIAANDNLATLSNISESKVKDTELDNVNQNDEISEPLESESSQADPTEALKVEPSSDNQVQSLEVVDSVEEDIAEAIDSVESQSNENKPIEKNASSQEVKFTSEERFFLNRPSVDWVIQLSGFSRLDSAAQFIKQNMKVGELHFYRTNRFGGDWYVVVLGPFKQKNDALSAKDKLPTELKQRQPWLKSVADVQQEIRSVN
ncbi:SPOR domain-containing protein [Pleionea sediminis]|uniref:SPOR domain-containing protein n=1 Tax=Pleionea sediminis TaxID=2569479 RepID=UPI001184BBCE|nr:SPOR domain-containing protein [Pleionea sediminis]